MKTNYIRLVTLVALVSILILQGIWLFNTYKLLEGEFRKNVSSTFILSIEKEAILRVDDPTRPPTHKRVEGVRLQNDHYTNNRAIQDWIYEERNFLPISLEKLDSIFNQDSKKSFKHLNYSFVLSDSLGNETAFFSHVLKNTNERFAYKETIQLRNIAPEYITLVVASPYKIIFGQMLLLLIGSIVVVAFVVYSLILQIRIINKQDKIATLRQDFTHAMIHDMKNPVMSILMGVSTLKSGKADDKPQVKEHFYVIITQEGERILKLANKVLEIAQFEGQQVILNKQVINLPEMLENLKEKKTTQSAKKVVFHFDLNNVETIYADQHYIYEVFDNLIDNAIKYSKENNDVEITITYFHKGNNIQLIFKDNGIGIAAKDQKKIFQKFERSMAVINNKNKISGFGLGLNFVYQVIKAHGGTITVNSQLGSYSEFIISLPTKKDNENDKIATD
jgi:two-component system phosphate regulon sensor histidine kinase PhoR